MHSKLRLMVFKGCRPYISIDSTHLNGQWNGQLPSANGIDGHNWMFPIAFGFFQSETKENWIWFMEQLAKALGPVEHGYLHRCLQGPRGCS